MAAKDDLIEAGIGFLSSEIIDRSKDIGDSLIKALCFDISQSIRANLLLKLLQYEEERREGRALDLLDKEKILMDFVKMFQVKIQTAMNTVNEHDDSQFYFPQRSRGVRTAGSQKGSDGGRKSSMKRGRRN
jgi:hypothetical protein